MSDARAGYPQIQPLQTRWSDNDLYGHVNNVIYYSYFDSAINRYLIERGVLQLDGGDTIGVCVASNCEYRRSIAYPEDLEIAFRAGKIGRTSVTYELAIFKVRDPEPVATGSFVHVFVDRQTRTKVDIPPAFRAALEAIRTVQGIERTESPA